VLCGACLGRYAEGETMLAHAVLGALRPGMLCLADRQFFGHALWPDFDSQRPVGTRANAKTIPNQRPIGGPIAAAKWRSAKFYGFEAVYA
jgi:hypothetical protein